MMSLIKKILSMRAKTCKKKKKMIKGLIRVLRIIGDNLNRCWNRLSQCPLLHSQIVLDLMIKTQKLMKTLNR